MQRNIPLTSARRLAPSDFHRWVLGGIALTAASYAVITTVGVSQFGWHAEFVPRMFIVTMLCALALVLAMRGYEMTGSVLALVATWTEVQIGFYVNTAFPSPGMLVLPVIVAGIGLLAGRRIALLCVVLTIVSTTLTHRFGPLSHSGFTPISVYWLVVHVISMLTAWALMALSMSAYARVYSEFASSDLDLADTIRFAPDGILILDGDGRAVHANPRAEVLIDRASADIVGREVRALLPESTVQHTDFLALGTVDGGPMLVSRTRDDGAQQHLEVTWRRMERQRFQLLLHDVTDRVEAEARTQAVGAQLAHAQRLEAVGLLAGGLSHDFNNILTAVSGSAELLRREHDPLDRDALLDEIIAARDRGAALTHQLLAFARRDVAQPRVIDVADHVHGMERLLERVAGDRVRLELALAADCRVRVDPGQYEQALVNLVANARDAMPEGGTCTITVAPATTADGDRVLIHVTDDGIGMTDDIVTRAFEPFFTTKPRGQGTGLGLASVHGVALRSGGSAAIASQPGRGTRVTLELPRVDDPVAPVSTRTDTVASISGDCTILVAEDDAGTRRIVARILESVGYSVRVAADGAEALREIQRDGANIHLLLTDVMMPGLTGPELATQARAQFPVLPVLFMTGYTEAQVRADSGVALDGAVITKPFSGSALTERIADALRAASSAAPH